MTHGIDATTPLSVRRGLAAIRSLAPFRRQRWRRGLVLFIAAIWLLVAIRLVASPPALLEFLVLSAVALVVALALVVLTRRVTASTDADIDERERTVRDRVHRLAYWWLSIPNGAVLGYVMLVFWWRGEAGRLEVTSLEASLLPAMAMTMVVLWTWLPELIVLWTEPDPPTDEEDV